MDFRDLTRQVEQFAQAYLEKGQSAPYCFHDKKHTQGVVDAVKEMVAHYHLGEREEFILVAAAFFHDLGYQNGGASGHEKRSAALATDFLQSLSVDVDIQEAVADCILATQMPQAPKGLLEEIICDADLFHLGSADFEVRNKLMHQEIEKINGHKVDKSLWRTFTIELMKDHRYHTAYAIDKLSAGKEANLAALRKKQKKDDSKQDKPQLTERNGKPERGIETMFRITSSNSQRLSDMADNKANILLTVTSIILSLVVSVLLRSLDNNPHLIFPTILLMVVVVTVMVFAILATIPKIPEGRYTAEDVENKSVNLLFFGNFYRMPLSDYKRSMERVMDDKDFLYGMLTKDVYAQGVVLGRKYRLLRYAYGIFMFGLVVCVLTFVVSILTLGK